MNGPAFPRRVSFKQRAAEYEGSGRRYRVDCAAVDGTRRDPQHRVVAEGAVLEGKPAVGPRYIHRPTASVRWDNVLIDGTVGKSEAVERQLPTVDAEEAEMRAAAARQRRAAAEKGDDASAADDREGILTAAVGRGERVCVPFDQPDLGDLRVQ